jgi:hypothetical protein
MDISEASLQKRRDSWSKCSRFVHHDSEAFEIPSTKSPPVMEEGFGEVKTRVFQRLRFSICQAFNAQTE